MRSILTFVLFAAMLCWLMFAPIYKHVFIVRQAVLQQEVDYLLEIGASGAYGYIDAAMIAASRNRLASWGLDPAKLIYEVTTTSGADATNPLAPVRRGTGIVLTIRYPYERIFEIDRLIGITPPDEHTLITATGMKMSEYVP
ncbi:MAG: hypothetical protein A9Z00_05445 [Thermobacillus sp. ZCTH02-B1]|uniref:hypothetical protein n=1 Tax=Thermobacillus sp. ZCTH02-B1 TaxID=1858795 RepID=UPI000B583D34|nr:hypothetical protein [Thermobacillus sp. ZCTH02-B1]OUM97313.1 MAG: hypothetical protein A9Z00_05445 [Thermobacillus sp. ZCTH02-B1]